MTALWTWLLSVLGTVGVAALALAVPVIRESVGKYVAGFVQHHFDERIETLRSELRTTEQQLKSLADAALSLRSSRQAALDVRRLQAVEKLWEAKIGIDRMKMAANAVSLLNLEEVFKAAESGEAKIKEFAQFLSKAAGFDFTNQGEMKIGEVPSALSEQPFLPPNIWALFSAYQRVMTTSVLYLSVLSIGTTKYIKKEDLMKPLMLSVLPEYKDYIEKHGFSGYYHLLDVLEQKLLNAITAMLEGKDLDDATIKRSGEIMSAVLQALNIESKKPDIPDALRGPDVPEPPKKQ